MSDKKVVSLGEQRSKHKEDEEREEVAKASENESEQEERVYCSFCGRPNTEVVKMV